MATTLSQQNQPAPGASPTPLDELERPEVFELYRRYVNQIITFDAYDEALVLRRALYILLNRREIEKNYGEMYQAYQHLLALLSFVVLPSLPDRDVIALVEEYVADALSQSDIVLEDKVIAKIVTILHEQRDSFKRQLREALIRNQQLLTGSDLKSGGQTVSPTVGNWLVDYNRVVGPDAATRLARVEYLITSENGKKLAGEDRRKVQSLLGLYERLKRSTFSPEGLEEAVSYYEGGSHYVLKDGKLELVKADPFLARLLGTVGGSAVEPHAEIQKSLSDLEKKVLTAYQGEAKFQQAVAKAAEALAAKTLNRQALRDEFYHAVQVKNIEESVAVLRLMAQRNEVEPFLKEDKKLNDFLAGLWEKQEGKDLADEFRQNPAQPKFVRRFLHYVFVERLGLKTSEAAREALKIGNIFVKSGRSGYNKMAFFDERSLAFVWFGDEKTP